MRNPSVRLSVVREIRGIGEIREIREIRGIRGEIPLQSKGIRLDTFIPLYLYTLTCQVEKKDVRNLIFSTCQVQGNLTGYDNHNLELDSTELAGLIPIAENSNGTAGVQARSILEYGYGCNYFNCPDFNDTAGYKISNFNMEDFTRVYGIEITVKPNPARGWTAFNYQLTDDMSKGVITITDVYGKLIETIAISGYQGQRIWDTRNIKSGIYYYTLNVSGLSKSGKLIINK